MKKLLLVLCLLSASSYAHAFGSVVYKPILKGPGTAQAYQAFLRAFRNAGAERCDPNIHAACRGVHVSIITAQAGRSSFVVVTATGIDYRTDSGQLLSSVMRTVFRSNLQRAAAKGLIRELWLDRPMAK